MKSRVLAAFAVAAMLAGFAAGWLTNGWRLGAGVAALRAQHSQQLQDIAEATMASLIAQQTKQQALTDELAILDRTYTERLTHAQAENRRLQDSYFDADNERRRLRIEVRVARNDATVLETTGTGRLVDDTTLELSAAAGRAVWNIRRGMIEDQEKLRYLQGRETTIADGLQ